MARTLALRSAAQARAVERQLHDEIAAVALMSDWSSLSQRQRVRPPFRIQRSISERAPTATVLDSITASAAEPLPSTIIGLRLVDRPAHPALVAVVGEDGILQRTNSGS
jgi:hypothetical protein